MAKHPTVVVPNIGPMDHAWDLLGEWHAEFEPAEGDKVLKATIVFEDWASGRADLDPGEARDAGLPLTIGLERTSDVHLTEAGGGALQWALSSPHVEWTVQAILWPGALNLFVYDAQDEEQELFRARAQRSREYYARKYPGEV
ncbi:MAG: hypothetical protein NW201_08055 [Gemmatimonadales bacterium]|nr:hypothetical protein [Gemmatimonadales bacterium]